MYKNDFSLTTGCYLLNHSVGRGLKSSQDDFNQHFFAPWQGSNKEPWQQWLASLERFTGALSQLFNSPVENFCPQVNLSSGLTKIVMSHPRLQKAHCKVLMAESDFPSMGFAMQKALPDDATIDFIKSDQDLSDPHVWQRYLSTDYDLVFISHAYSNTGQQAPLESIVSFAKQHNVLTLIDVAQSAGVLALDLNTLQPDFMIGSSVKWLCGGSGAAYLWVNPTQLSQCQPQDVGWFSHQTPFEFDIHHFDYHKTALRFWGGTPSIAPYVIAGHSIDYFARLGVDKVRAHNSALLDKLSDEFTPFLISPSEPHKRSGTAILNFAKQQEAVLKALKAADISVDARAYGVRVSPHIYNDLADIKHFITVVNSAL